MYFLREDLSMLKKIFICFVILVNVYPAIYSLELGKAWLDKDTAFADEKGDWAVHYEAGKMGVAVGGGIRIQFPHAWFVRPWGSDIKKEVQSEFPQKDHYVHAETTRDGADFDILIHKESVDLQHDRWQKTCDLILKGNDLLPGDTVSFTFSNTTVPQISEKCKIAVGVDAGANRFFVPINDYPEFTIKPGKAEKLLVFLPSGLRRNKDRVHRER